jgi:hypothetical protein
VIKNSVLKSYKCTGHKDELKGFVLGNDTEIDLISMHEALVVLVRTWEMFEEGREILLIQTT